MNLFSILKQIFPDPPTLQEFIEAHNPSDIHEVEYLERQYDRFMDQTFHRQSIN